jgi:hypothetical protein
MQVMSYNIYLKADRPLQRLKRQVSSMVFATRRGPWLLPMLLTVGECLSGVYCVQIGMGSFPIEKWRLQIKDEKR